MAVQKVCPIRDVGKAKCLEDNCALWVSKDAAVYEVKTEDEGHRTVYDPVGACSILVIASRLR